MSLKMKFLLNTQYIVKLYKLYDFNKTCFLIATVELNL